MRQVEFDVRALAAELHERRLLDVALVALHHVICTRRTEHTVKKQSQSSAAQPQHRTVAIARTWGAATGVL
jgi:hypothetical protein